MIKSSDIHKDFKGVEKPKKILKTDGVETKVFDDQGKVKNKASGKMITTSDLNPKTNELSEDERKRK